MRINEPINSSMKRIFRIDYFLFFLFLTCPSIIKAENESVLRAHHANYSVSVRGIGGTLNTKLNQDDGTYQASNELKAKGLSRIFLGGTVNEKSFFRITDKELKPLSFYSTDKMSKRNKTIFINFDYEEDLGISTINENETTFKNENNLYDRISLKFALMNDLKKNNLKKEYSLYEGEEIKLIQIEVLEEKIISVPFGEFKAIAIKSQQLGSSKRSIFWCADKLDFLPIVIEQYRNDKLWMKASLTSHGYL